MFDSISPLLLLYVSQIWMLPYFEANVACVTRDEAPGYCLPYEKCANLTQWRLQHQLQSRDDVEKFLCNGDAKEAIYICYNRTNPYFSSTDYLAHLHPKGLAILEATRCTPPHGDRISNGATPPLGEYPFMALLRYDEPMRPFKCGGSLITLRFVLTAGHCITPELIGVRLGEHDLTKTRDCRGEILCLPEAEDFGIERTVTHPLYMNPKLAHDIALLKLNRDAGYKVHIKPICLPISTMTIEFDEVPSYSIAGWGHTENSTRSEVLQHATVPHRERVVCQQIFAPFNIQITYDHICAGGERDVDSCKGDSGGPLFTVAPFKKNIDGAIFYRYVQYGIVSFGLTGCGGNTTKAAAYANVVQHMPWITENIS